MLSSFWFWILLAATLVFTGNHLLHHKGRDNYAYHLGVMMAKGLMMGIVSKTKTA